MTERYGLCKFPMWPDDEPPSHVYCNMRTAPGFPYCDIHAQKTYVGYAAKKETEAQDQAK